LIITPKHRSAVVTSLGYRRRGWAIGRLTVTAAVGADELEVWVDQDLCTGDGLCEEIAPAVFTLLDDGLAYVKEGDKVYSDPGGADGLAVVPGGMEEAVIESAEECPGECIFIEVD
jgi:ferredoxin